MMISLYPVDKDGFFIVPKEEFNKIREGIKEPTELEIARMNSVEAVKDYYEKHKK